MQEFSFFSETGGFPAAYDQNRAAVGLERWLALADEAEAGMALFIRSLAADTAGRSFLSAVFGNSPFLGQILIQEPATVRTLICEGPETALARTLSSIGTLSPSSADELMHPLRVARRQVALITAGADIAGAWPVLRVTNALSDFADAALRLAVAHLLRDAAAAGEIRLAHQDDPQRDSGFVVIAMGKLGARELNYSSDIDLLILFDQEKIAYTGPRSPQDCYVRISRSLVRLMQERTRDGYVFRTDLRLRPDPGATPVALSMAAAESYYESLGQNWERAALIKARPAAGDIAAGEAFLDRIAPFIWRKYLDFAAIEDIHSIKRQIHAHKGHGAVAVAGHNIKLGRGGIREIEFFAQTQQLIAGGRDRHLRQPATCNAIRGLAATGRLSPAVADELVASYEVLRRVEHRLQMIDDEQIHTLPAGSGELDHLATFLGYAGTPAFEAELRAVLDRVQHHYGALFEQAPALGSVGSLVFTGTEDDPETLKTLARLGFSEPVSVAATIRGWHHGRYRAMRSERAREKLTAIMPRLLEALSRTAHPDTAFARFDEFLGRLPAGIQIFSLLFANPELLDLVAEVLGAAPRLAEILSRNPSLLDGMLGAELFQPLPAADQMALRLDTGLAQARDFQDTLDMARRWCNDRRLQIGLQMLRGTIDAVAGGIAVSDLAEAILRVILDRVEAEFARQHGRLKGGAVCIVGLGRLGSREMTLTSDLDLIFIYDHPPQTEASDGPRPLSPAHYYARLGQRVINALTALTGEGQLFPVDMRLRPSGHAGPVATSLAAFTAYQREAAWTWEHMALTRARTVAGPPSLTERVQSAIHAILVLERDPARLVREVDEMRQRIATERPAGDPWDIKYVRGGLVDIEFICQYLQLRHAAEVPDVLAPNTAQALRRLEKAGRLRADIAMELLEALQVLGTVLALTRLCESGPFTAATAPPALKALLARASDSPDFLALAKRLLALQSQISDHYATLIGLPAAAASSAETSDRPPR